ncbi:MAG: DUF5117 domain-containing protein, partial [Chthonomonadaceae bacterium]|nr:DUF5117 domain-containing protein [Chthonomonadaceae bacterium]
MTVILILALASLREPIQEPPAKNPPVQQDDKKAAPKQEEKKPEEKKDPYQDAIKDMSKKDGVVSVFNKDETYYFQVPQNILGRDFLWTTELKQTPSGMYSGTMTASSVVRFEQRGEKVLVRTIDYSVRATEGEEIKFGVEQSNVNPIIKTFSVKAKSPDGGLLIDVGSWFKGDIPDFSVKQALGGVMIDGERSFINKVKVFPTNVNVEVTQT